MMALCLILGLVTSAFGACPSASFVDSTSLPAAPVFPTAIYGGALPANVLEDHYGEIAKIGAYRPPRIVPCAQPLRTNCAHLSSGLKNWHDPATWGGTIPTSGSVTLPFNTRVLVASCSIDPNTIWDRITIPLGSELVFADAPISIKIKSMAVIGKLTIGTPTCRLQNKINIEIGPDIRAIDDSGLTKGIVINGTCDIHGVEYAPTWTRLAATAAAGSSVIFVQDMVNWEAGQEVLVTTTELKDARDFNHNEVKVISKVERTSKDQVAAITLTTPLAFGHYGGSEYQAEVALLSRRIKIQGDASSEPTDVDNGGVCTTPNTKSTYPCPDKYLTGFGGHVMVIGSVASARFEGIELYRMGQTNMLGRYPLHFHLMGDLVGTDRAVFRDNSVHHSFFRCYAIHGTHGVQVSRNVGYDATGHCYFIEDGIEENNTFTYNFASHIHPLGPIQNPSHGANGDSWWSQGLSWYPETPQLVLPSDMSAAGFYITNPHNDFIGNAASGGWTGFAMPSLRSPVKLFQSRTDVSPKNRPFRSPFRGNSAHSSGFWWGSAGAFYIGGELRHQSVNGPLEYTAGRSATKDTCSDRKVGTPGGDGGCYDEAKHTWLRFEDNKAFLASRGLQNWGDRSELIRFEFHNVNLAMNVFGKVLIDQLLMECRTQTDASLPAWFSGCATGTASGVAPPWGTCNQRDIQFWTGYQGFQWYDVGQMHILTNSIFRNCPDKWSKCAYNSGGGGLNSNCGSVTVFLSLTHSDQFVPQMQQLTSGIKLENVGKKWGFTTKLTDGGQDTVSGRLQSWVDFDGTVSGTGVRTMLGSKWAGDWWKYNDQCTVPDGTTEFWVCPLQAKDSYVSMFFGPGKAAPVNNQPSSIMPASVGSSNCMNGGQSAAAGNLCPIIGTVTHFGRDETTGIKLALNGKITGPLVGCAGGWYVRFNTSPQTLTINEFQIAKEDVFILAIPYPVGTTFTIAYKAATWCNTAWGTCTHPVTPTTSLANVRNGFGDLYYWDNSKGILYLRVVQRSSTVGTGGAQSTDKPYTTVIDPEVTFSRNDLTIIESAYQTYLQIDAVGTMAAVNPGVPAAFDAACNPVANCPTDGVWVSINAGASRIIPCGSGFYGTQSRRCGSTGSWEAVVRDNCKVGNAFCPADNGWEVTPPGILAQHQCPCGQNGVNTRQCDSNGIWQTAVNSCVGAATCSDKIQNGAETGVDCGGSCPACTYCGTISCGDHGTCVEGNPPTCTCQDNWTGPRCATPPVDPCASINCGTYGVCQNGACVCNSGYSGTLCATPPAQTCSDGIKNQDEVNIDCGGTKCLACPTYSWIPTAWTSCSKTCGGGTHTRTVTCQDNNNKVVADTLCDGAHTLDKTEACNVDACPTYSWKIGAFGTCSANCGGGSQTRQVDCISSVGSTVVEATLCGGDASRPVSTQGCNTEACVVPRWVAGQYTACTVTCGGGSQTRSVDCLNPDNSPAAADKCTDTKPVTTQSCNVVMCGTYSWKACPTFYPCTAQCNGGGAMVGVQYRDVFCFKDQDLSVVDASLCTAVKPTSALSVCNPEKCTKPNWMADANWGPCTQGADGVWTRNRTFHCHNADGTTALLDVCKSGAGPLPVSVLPCSPGTCSDANGCPQVQLGAVFSDCKDGIDPCSPECAASASALADELSALGLKSILTVQCAKDLFNNLPVGFKPSQTLVDEISTALSTGKLNVCASISGSGVVVASWVVTIGAFAMALSV